MRCLLKHADRPLQCTISVSAPCNDEYTLHITILGKDGGVFRSHEVPMHCGQTLYDASFVVANRHILVNRCDHPRAAFTARKFNGLGLIDSYICAAHFRPKHRFTVAASVYLIPSHPPSISLPPRLISSWNRLLKLPSPHTRMLFPEFRPMRLRALSPGQHHASMWYALSSLSPAPVASKC